MQTAIHILASINTDSCLGWRLQPSWATCCNVMVGQKACDIIVSIDEVPDEEIRTTLKKVKLHYSLLFIVSGI